MAIYSAFSPNGSGLAIPPLYVGQIAAMVVVGLVGGGTARFWRSGRARSPWTVSLAAGGVGVALTLVYQCAVVAGLAVAMPEFNQGLWAAVVANAFFSILHVVSNGVIFAVLSPVLLRRLPSGPGPAGRGRATPPGVAALLALALCVVLALPAAAGRASVVSGPAGGAEGIEAAAPTDPGEAAETTAARADSVGVRDPDAGAPADTTAAERAVVAAPPGDIRVARSSGVAGLLARRPGVRATGTGWSGHHASLSAGALPASLTGVRIAGRDFCGWTSGGLSLLTATAAVEGPVYVPDGADLSVWAAHDAPDSIILVGPLLSTVHVERWPASPARPFARLTMLSGALGGRVTSGEFDRTWRDGSLGVSASFEQRDGRAPVDGGRYEYDAAGGQIVVRSGGDWDLAVSGQHIEVDRGVPGRGQETSGLATEEIVSTADAELRTGAIRVGFYHDEGWLAVKRPGCNPTSLQLARDGVSTTIAMHGGPLSSATFVAATRSAVGSGPLFSERVLELEGLIERGVTLSRSWRLDVSAGWSQLAGQGYPLAGASLSRVGGGSDLFVDVSAGGRHPTPVERSLMLENDSTCPAPLRGDATVEPARGLRLSAGWSGEWALGDAGVRGEAVRLFGPLALSDGGASWRAVNWDDESTASVSLWASTGEEAKSGVSASATLLALDPDGAVLSLEPAADAEVECTAWTSHAMFARDYLSVRWEVSLRHERGLSRGPWEGVVDDDTTLLSIVFAAEADAARVYALLEDALDDAPTLVPGCPGPGRSLSAGFSWTFWD